MKIHKIDEMKASTLTKMATHIYNKKMDPSMVENMAKSDALGRVVGLKLPNYSRLSAAHNAVSSVHADDILAAGHSGPKVGMMMHEKRVNEVKKRKI